MTDGNANPLASAGETDDATGVDGGSDDWAKAVLDGLRADDARSDTRSDDGGEPDHGAKAVPAKADSDASSLPPVADRDGGYDDYVNVSIDEETPLVASEPPTEPSVAADPIDVKSTSKSGPESESESVGESGSVDEADPLCAADGEVVDNLDPGETSNVNADVSPPPPPQGPPLAPGSVEDLVSDLERVTGERDTYLESSRRIQAEFENYRKQVGKRETEARERANESLVAELLPVLDACDGAVANGADDVAPISASLVDVLTKQGLERIDPTDAPFDPEFHEAVMHDDGDGDGGPVVAEVMRAGYSWKGRVVRPAMVRVRG